jgi:hypothetical protein
MMATPIESSEREPSVRPTQQTALLFFILALCSGQVAVAQEEESFWEQLKDPEDGALDFSSFLLSPAGFVPFPIVVTEPAVGYGGGLALAFFHADKEAYEAKEASGDEEFGPLPSISVAVGAYTENGTWIAGGGHLGIWKDGNIRYTGFAGLTNVNLDFYVGDRPFAFNIDGAFLLQDVKFRLGSSDAFLGAAYSYFDSKTTFDLPGLPEGVDNPMLESSLAGLAGHLYWDSRDTIFTPNKGVEGELKVTWFNEAVGGDFDYWEAGLKLRSFHQLHERFVLGWRADGAYTTDGAPFYALPFVDLRGIPAMRYQDQWAAVAELEGRWNVYKRWSLIGFAGKGWIGGDNAIRETENNIIAGGVGFRYLLSRLFGLHVGIDVARGPEDTAFYLQAGTAWR